MAIVIAAPKIRLVDVCAVIFCNVDCSLLPESFSSPALIVCMPYRNSASPPKSEMIEYTSIVSLPVFCNTPINLFYIITELRQKATQTFTARSFA